MIESPCIGICTLIDEKCIGCYRTKNQIMKWLHFSDKEREKITLDCKQQMHKKIEK